MRVSSTFWLILLLGSAASPAYAVPPKVDARTAPASDGPAVGVQYDTTHIYVPTADVDRFVASFLATFGGRSTKQAIATVTPTPSLTSTQLLLTPVGTVSVFGFRTPIPYPFGAERTGYLVRDIDRAVREAKSAGAAVLVQTFPDPIGRDAVLQWPGGVNMQLYWHTTPPSYPALATVPENRVYVPAETVGAFVASFNRFAHGHVISDDPHAPGEEIGRAGYSYRRIRIVSPFGNMAVFVTDGQLPYPFGREITGYEVSNLALTLGKAKAAGATILAGPYAGSDRQAAIVDFPGGYLAEVHAVVR